MITAVVWGTIVLARCVETDDAIDPARLGRQVRPGTGVLLTCGTADLQVPCATTDPRRHPRPRPRRPARRGPPAHRPRLPGPAEPSAARGAPGTGLLLRPPAAAARRTAPSQRTCG